MTHSSETSGVGRGGGEWHSQCATRQVEFYKWREDCTFYDIVCVLISCFLVFSVFMCSYIYAIPMR